MRSLKFGPFPLVVMQGRHLVKEQIGGAVVWWCEPGKFSRETRIQHNPATEPMDVCDGCVSAVEAAFDEATIAAAHQQALTDAKKET